MDFHELNQADFQMAFDSALIDSGNGVCSGLAQRPTRCATRLYKDARLAAPACERSAATTAEQSASCPIGIESDSALSSGAPAPDLGSRMPVRQIADPNRTPAWDAGNPCIRGDFDIAAFL